MAGKHWFLKNCRLFERLPPDELQRLEAVSRLRKYAAGSVIYVPEGQADALLTLVSGRVKLCHTTPDGKETILAFIEPGEVFGELCLLGDGGREELAIAMDAASLVLIPREAVQRLMERRMDLTLSVSRLFSFRRSQIERRLKYLLFHSNRDRLIHLLLELLETYGERTADGTLIRLRLSHQDIASVIGSTRETVTATLGELQQAGLIRIGRMRIVVVSPQRLAEAADAPSQPRSESAAEKSAASVSRLTFNKVAAE